MTSSSMPPFVTIAIVVFSFLLLRALFRTARRGDIVPRARRHEWTWNDEHGKDDYAASREAWECRTPECRAENPGHARFCRMCGAERS